MDIHDRADVEATLPVLITKRTRSTVIATVPQKLATAKLYRRNVAVGGQSSPLVLAGIVVDMRYVGPWTELEITLSR